MDENKSQIAHPFEMKRDATGKLIPPEFLNDETSGPTVPTVDQVRSQQVSSPAEESASESETQPAPESNVSEQEPESNPEPDTQKPTANRLDNNLRSLRKNLEKERNEKEMMARELEMYRRVHESPSQQPSRAVQDHSQDTQDEAIDLNFADDDIVEGKQLKKIVHQLQQKVSNFQKASAQQAYMAHQSALELQLKAQYPDFDSVVTKENLKDLAAAYPELAATIHSSNDLRSQAVTAYTMIKNLNIAADDAAPTYEADKERARKNLAKPRSASAAPATQMSPLANAAAFSELTPSLKKQLYAEMETYRKRI